MITIVIGQQSRPDTLCIKHEYLLMCNGCIYTSINEGDRDGKSDTAYSAVVVNVSTSLPISVFHVSMTTFESKTI